VRGDVGDRFTVQKNAAPIGLDGAQVLLAGAQCRGQSGGILQ
jgi:hypothetical protein